ncbi:copper homeostasis protein CutC [Frigoriglobus tundricola]|uniref:PF03932 family protein CutC n=1 Tax=Frigoriglobus tundricola TaxID=2774151 RepID=A0A6M5Z0I3_9BACT|nr:copper homeostasis protein CutC [Frigoriglobus tundricola]QJW99658.1 Cytoplasmic copper homeostasis protein cutC [Frigoriglobus tundricola]
MTPRVAIIGGGLAGLTAAHRLLARNIEVTVIDKGRHGGGRMCTRPVVLPDGRTARFDLGPPLLYTRVPGDPGATAHRVIDLDNELPGPSLFTSRPVGRIGAPGEGAGPAPITGLTTTGGMRELPFRLIAAASGALHFQDHTLVERLERTELGWRVHTRSLRDGFESVASANALILTPPVPQTLELLQNSNIALPDALRDDLRGVAYSRCIAVYGTFDPVEPLHPGGVWLGDGPVEWICDNHRKDVSAVPGSITALTSPAWAEEHWDVPDELLLELLLPRLSAWVGSPTGPGSVWVHRWRWARPVSPVRAPCAVLRDHAAVLAGDGFAGQHADAVDAAVTSGEAAAHRTGGLLTALARRDTRYSVPRPPRYTLEIAVSTPAEAALAVRAGADRLELSCALEVGGLTPSIGLFRAVREWVEVPVYVMLRPRAGGFMYRHSELEIMWADAEAFLSEGASGIVFAALKDDGAIDHVRCRQFVERADGKAVFHRAFDFLSDPLAALDELIELGFERVLTSGGASTAETGTNRLAALVQHAGWQIEVLPAGSVRPHNVADLVRTTRCDQVHSAARVPADDPLLSAHPRLARGLGAPGELDERLVRGLRHELDRLAGSLS